MWPIIIGAAVGLAKSYLDQQEAQRQRKVQADVARYSPWTGMTPQTNIKNANYMEGAMSGALTGAAYGQNAQALAAMQATKSTPPSSTQAPLINNASLMQSYPQQQQNMSTMYDPNDDPMTRFFKQKQYGQSAWNQMPTAGG